SEGRAQGIRAEGTAERLPRRRLQAIEQRRRRRRDLGRPGVVLAQGEADLGGADLVRASAGRDQQERGGEQSGGKAAHHGFGSGLAGGLGSGIWTGTDAQ